MNRPTSLCVDLQKSASGMHFEPLIGTPCIRYVVESEQLKFCRYPTNGSKRVELETFD